MTISMLHQASVGAPICRLGVSFFPIYLHKDALPEIHTGEDSGLEIEELAEAEVSALLVKNTRAALGLLVEGEHLLGGKQNRLVNATVLMAANSSLQVPVTCLERGRWGQRRAYERSEARTSFEVRRRAQADIMRSVRTRGSRRSDQHAVWNEVDAELERAGVRSPTAAAADGERIALRDSGRMRAVEALNSKGPLPAQCGVAIAEGEWVRSIEIFGNEALLGRHWQSLIRAGMRSESAHRSRASADRVLRILAELGSAQSEDCEAVGLGREHRTANGAWVGQALTLDNAMVHASFFSTR